MGEAGASSYVVKKPDNRDGSEPEPVEAQNEHVGGFTSHRLLGKLLWLLEAQTQDKENERKDDANAKARAPDGFVVAVVSSSGNNN